MKKLLVMLMVVAMASFLFVGCFGTTPDIPDEDEEPAVAVTGVTLDEATLALTVGDAAVTLVATVAPADATDPRVIWASSDEIVAIVAAGVVTPLNAGISAITATTIDGGFVATCVVTVTAESEPMPVSTTPVINKITNVETILGPDIINLYSSETQYMNEDEVEDGILVFGFAPKYSDIQVYVDGAVVGTGISYGVLEGFLVFVAEDDLGVDGDKTLYATATEVGLDESDASIEYAFTLDTVAPELVSVTAEMDIEDYPDGTVTVTFSEELDADTVDEDTAADIDDWIVNSIFDGDISIDNVELVSPKVVELEADFEGEDWEGNIIRVAYEDADDGDTPITDLAGNPADESSEYCYLEIVEEEEPEPTNEAPVITSAAITSGKVGVAYTYDVDATDPDEDILTYSLTEKPLGMAIVAATGEISWDPTDAGVFEVGVKVADPDGLFDVQDFEITVVEADEPDPTNEAPVITSATITSGTVGELYIYTVVAEDPDEDILTYSLTANPLGMTIVAATGEISWTPNAAGFFVVGVKVADPDGLFDVQSFVITVTAPTVIDIPAILGVTAPVTGVIPVTEITETVQYTGTVTWSGTPVIFAAGTIYTATITLTPEAGYTLTGVAADFFTVAGTTTDTNPINSGVVTAVFPVTVPAPVVLSAAFTNATTLVIVYNEAVTTVLGDYTPGAVTPAIPAGATTFAATALVGSTTDTITLTVGGFVGAVSTPLATGDTAVIAIAATVASLAVPTNTLVAIPAQAVAAF